MRCCVSLSFLTVALFTAGCSSTTESCAPSSTMLGAWTYRAQRETPVPGTISGTLSIESQRCDDVHGVMDVIETVGGESRRLTGPVSGTVIDGALLRFDAQLNGGEREHLARIAADSLAGSWVETTTAGGSGAFSAHREQR